MENILAVRQNDILYLHFYSPKLSNCFGVKEAKLIDKYLKQNFKALVFLSKHPKVFCSGGNLKDYYNKSSKENLQTNQQIRQVLQQINDLDVPSICLIDGLCLGGGMEVLSAFDYVWTSPKSLFAFWQRKIGLSFGWGGRERLVQRMGESHLIQYALSTQYIDGYKAKELGLVDRIIPMFQMKTSLQVFLDKLLTLENISTAAIKNRENKNEIDLFEGLWLNPHHKKILESFNGRNT